MKTIQLQKEDRINLAADYYPSTKKNGNENGIILLHMLNSNRKSWEPIEADLLNLGYSVISIDMRGHGESNGDWKKFSQDDFNKMVLDAKAGKDYLISQGIEKDRIVVIGASIGANTALNFAAADPDIKTIVLLSPGLNYRGVETETSASQFSGSVLCVVSEEDTYSFDSVNILFDKVSGQKKRIDYQNAGHGTRMFDSEPELKEKILDWLAETL